MCQQVDRIGEIEATAVVRVRGLLAGEFEPADEQVGEDGTAPPSVSVEGISMFLFYCQ